MMGIMTVPVVPMKATVVSNATSIIIINNAALLNLNVFFYLHMHEV